jgi:hypothetical protein
VFGNEKRVVPIIHLKGSETLSDNQKTNEKDVSKNSICNLIYDIITTLRRKCNMASSTKFHKQKSCLTQCKSVNERVYFL